MYHPTCSCSEPLLHSSHQAWVWGQECKPHQDPHTHGGECTCRYTTQKHDDCYAFTCSVRALVWFLQETAKPGLWTGPWTGLVTTITRFSFFFFWIPECIRRQSADVMKGLIHCRLQRLQYSRLCYHGSTPSTAW